MEYGKRFGIIIATGALAIYGAHAKATADNPISQSHPFERSVQDVMKTVGDAHNRLVIEINNNLNGLAGAARRIEQQSK